MLASDGKAVLDKTGGRIGWLQDVDFGVSVSCIQTVPGERQTNDAAHAVTAAVGWLGDGDFSEESQIPGAVEMNAAIRKANCDYIHAEAFFTKTKNLVNFDVKSKFSPQKMCFTSNRFCIDEFLIDIQRQY